MTIKEVEDTLDNESELLQKMVEFVRGYDNDHFTGSARYIQESWAKFLTQRADTNLTVNRIGVAGDMAAEHKQLTAYINASVKKPQYSEKWREFFECEQSILEHLTNLLKKP